MNETNSAPSEIRTALSQETLSKVRQSPEKKAALVDFINRDVFRASSTGATYRQINHLDESGLLAHGRDEDSQGWRIFSLKDGIYIDILLELRKFGMRARQFQGLKRAFYDAPQIFDEAIVACLLGSNITLALDSEGDGYLFDTATLSDWDQDPLRGSFRGHVELRLIVTLSVNRVLKSLGISPPKTKLPASFFATQKLLTKDDLSSKEQQMLELIRDADYREISLSKKDGDRIVIKATQDIPPDITPYQFEQITDSINYGEVTVVKRDGRIVHHQAVKTIKL